MWTLILFAHVGAMGTGNSNALTSVPGFATEQLCRSAGQQARGMAGGSVKSIEYVCARTQ